MNILLINDDGPYSFTTKKLFEEMSKKHEVFVVVPSSNRSGSSHSITVFKQFRIMKVSENFYTVDAMPADCVKVAILGLMEKKVDLVVSGINIGPNLGLDIYYSGTFSAAREAALLGVNSISCSINVEWGEFDEKLFTEASLFVAKLVDNYPLNFVPKDIFPNINLPRYYFKDIKGIKVARAYERYYFEKTNIKKVCVSEEEEIFEVVLDGGVKNHIHLSDSDIYLCKNGYISYTMYSYLPNRDIKNYEIALYEVFRKSLDLTRALSL